ncbi:MAG TPA: hypothetical protein VIL34_18280 [Actinopolymorphaceae bacterium]
MRRRLCTLACLTLIWMLAFPAAAFAHCHEGISYGLMSAITDCAKAAVMGIVAVTTAAASSVAAFLSINYYWNQLKLEYWHQLLGLSSGSNDARELGDAVGKTAEAIAKVAFDLKMPDPVGFAAEWGAGAARFAWPALRLGWQWANEVAIKVGRFFGLW